MAGRPKIPPAVASMRDRGLVEVSAEQRMPRAYFTEAGMAALRQLASDRRFLDPVRYAHVRHELGLDEPGDGGPTFSAGTDA